MNKYQEALDTIKEVYEFEESVQYPYSGNIGEEYHDECSILQELVDRATPKKMKSIEFDGLRTYGNCPNCGSFHIKDGSTHCYHCGQALDWEKEGK